MIKQKFEIYLTVVKGMTLKSTLYTSRNKNILFLS